MTSKWFGLTPWPGGLGQHFGSNHGGAGTYAAVASALVLVLSASSAPHALSGASAPSPTPTAIAGAHSVDVAAPHGGAAFARGEDKNIDALAGIIARKYRVSEEATRSLVAAAYREGLRNGVDPLLLIAVIAIESRFNPIAQSDGGAVGLMQVIPRYHADKLDAAGRNAVLDPHMNIQVGARILKEYIARGGNEIAGLQLYNGSSADASNAYATRVLGEKQWLKNSIGHAKERARA